MSLATPLPGWGQDAPVSSRQEPKSKNLQSNEAEAIEESRFLILKERLDRLSKQLTKHKRPSSPGIPGHIEKKDLDLPAFPEMTEEDGIEDSILILKKRLEHLHHVLHQES